MIPDFSKLNDLGFMCTSMSLGEAREEGFTEDPDLPDTTNGYLITTEDKGRERRVWISEDDFNALNDLRCRQSLYPNS